MNHKITMKQILGLFFFFLICVIPLCYFYFTSSREKIVINQEFKEKKPVYGVNNYETVAISHDKVASIYYIEYINLLRVNPKEAYQKLDSQSKKKFQDYDEFLEWISSSNYSYQIERVVTVEKNNRYTYTIYDENKNVVVFTATSVMNYTVNIV